MLEVKSIDSIMAEKEDMIQKCKEELALLHKAQKTNRWFTEILDTVNQLVEAENIEVLKKVIRKARFVDNHVEGFITFDEGLLTSMEIRIMIARNKIVPNQFHEHFTHRMNHLPAGIDDTHIKKINIIVKSIETISAWCLHRLYVLDENPKFGR